MSTKRSLRHASAPLCHSERSEESRPSRITRHLPTVPTPGDPGPRPFAELILSESEGLRVTMGDDVEYGDRTVSMSEAARRAVEKLRAGV